MTSKKFTAFERRPNGAITYLPSAWRDYWEELTEGERESLRQKADWEHMTLSAVAIEWGAIDTEGAK